MKEVIVGKGMSSTASTDHPSTSANPPGLTADIVDVPVPEPGPDQVLIKIAVSGTNPKDWKRPEGGFAGNQGDDMAGVVAAVGANVTAFRPGDRVAAFHEMMQPHGSYAEYGLAWQHTTFHLPPGTTFEEAATLPLAALTAVFALYKHLRLPQPWTPRGDDEPPLPLAIYGASTAVGLFAVQLAVRSNVHPIVAIAGASADVVRAHLDPARGDAVVDYRQGEAGVIAGVRAALAAAQDTFPGSTAPLTLQHGFDPSGFEGGYVTLGKLLEGPGQRLAVILPMHDYKELEGRAAPLVLGKTYVGDAHGAGKADRDLAYVFSRYFSRALAQGDLRPHPHTVVPGGLGGIQTALQDLKADKAHGTKYVVRIAETAGL